MNVYIQKNPFPDSVPRWRIKTYQNFNDVKRKFKLYLLPQTSLKSLLVRKIQFHFICGKYSMS